jgi:NhaP-type Na+/H+ or K+/H+ antiporter
MHDPLTVTLGMIAVLGILAQWLAWRLRVPAIILLLGAGLAAGPGLGWLRPQEAFGDLLRPVVKLAVALILFEGGLHLKFSELKEAGRAVRRLVWPGVAISWVLGSLAAHFIGGLTWRDSLLVGAILVVTGPTVIMPLLRHARLKKRPASLLKWEGIVNDPIGALLAVLVYQFFARSGPGHAFNEVGLAIVMTIVLSAILGIAGGYLLAGAIRGGHVPEFLKSPVLLGSALAVYLLADLAQEEAGLAAVTAFGIVLGNRRLPSIDQLRRFKEYIVVVLVSTVFILLSANVDLTELVDLDFRDWLFVLVLLFVVRPVSVFAATAGAKLPFAERALVGWIAPRGVVAAAVTAAFAPAQVPLVFAIIIVTVVAHGLSIRWLARRLGLATASSHGVLIVGASPWSQDLATSLVELELPVIVADSSWRRLRPARMAGVPIHYGEILSEVSEEDLELAETGYLLAVTGNDAYNALVCTRFADELGRDRVFQFAIARADEDDPRGLHQGLRGQTLFDEEVGYYQLIKRHYEGWRFRKTTLTESFDEAALNESIGEDAIRILILKASGKPVFRRGRERIGAEPGDTVLVFAPPG